MYAQGLDAANEKPERRILNPLVFVYTHFHTNILGILGIHVYFLPAMDEIAWHCSLPSREGKTLNSKPYVNQERIVDFTDTIVPTAPDEIDMRND